MNNPDLTTTLAGGGAGMALLLTVKWESIHYGELIKVGVALGLVAFGYLMYRGAKSAG